LLLWCSKEATLAEGESGEETEGKIPQGLSGSVVTQKPNKGNRFRLLVAKYYSKLSWILEWTFTKP
jgi:hypothetical protein